MGTLFFRQSELEKRLDFFKDFRLNKKKKIYAWLVISSILLGGLCFLLVTSYLGTRAEYARVCSIQEAVRSELLLSQQKAKSLFLVKQANETLKKIITKERVHDERAQNVLEVLQAITKTIPEQTWLEKISFNKRSFRGDKKMKNRVALEGCSLSEKQVSAFHKKLEGASVLCDCQLAQLTRKADRAKFVFVGWLRC
ncbi:PilN domain-containing protein [Candidatus Babeliales bacterium]|nr:PilN domain-containing protein [Candidatus Babeliales bacterium]